MLNSLILMFSQYGKNRKISNIFKVVWVLYAIVVSFFNFNLLFSLINISVFLLVTGIISCLSKDHPKINAALSVASILVYSLFIDIICYYMIPIWAEGQSLMQYILNGFLYNYKYTFLNVVVLSAVVLCSKIYEKYLINKKIIVKNLESSI